MATEQDHLDDLFRKRFETAETPFDDENWKKVETLLQYEDRKRRRRIIAFIFLALLVAGLFSLLLFEKPIEKEQTSSQQVTITNSDKPDSSQNADNSIENPNSQQKAASDSLNLRKNPLLKITARSGENESNKSGEGESKMHNSVNTEKTTVNSSSSKNQKAINPINTVEEIGQTTSTSDFSRDSLDLIRILPYKISLISFPGPNDSLHLLSVHAGETFSSEEKPLPPFTISFSLGTKIRSGISGSSKKLFLSPLGGIEIRKPLTSSLSIGCGIFYSEINGLNLKDTSTQVDYFLDKELSQEYLTIHTLQVLSIPIGLQYKIAHAHSLFGGADANYFLNSRSDYAYMNSTSQGIESGGVVNARGYVDGVHSLNFDFHIGYEVSFSNKFGASISYQRSITDIVKPQYFSGADKLYNQSVNIMIHYKFL